MNENTVAQDIKEQAHILLETARERLHELDEHIKNLKKMEAERSLLLQEITHLEAIIAASPKVTYVITERTRRPSKRGRRVSADGRTIADHVVEILEEAYPQSLHWLGIYERLKARGIGTDWKSPASSVRMAIRGCDRIKQLLNGEYIVKRDVLPDLEADVTAEA